MSFRALLEYTERLDPPEDEPIGRCPNCGIGLGYGEEIYTWDVDGSAIGCEYCIKRGDAGDYFD